MDPILHNLMYTTKQTVSDLTGLQCNAMDTALVSAQTTPTRIFVCANTHLRPPAPHDRPTPLGIYSHADVRTPHLPMQGPHSGTLYDSVK